MYINPPTEVNENGDKTFYPSDMSISGNKFFRAEYKYDDTGNWIEKKIFKQKIENAQPVEEKLEKIIKRKIYYKKN